MAKYQSKQGSQKVSSKGKELTENSLGIKLQELLKQQKYRQALSEIKKIQQSHPEIQFSLPESEIWLLRGKQEFQKRNFKQAEKSFGRALELGLVGDVHYWQAKCLLESNQLDTALEFIRDAFDTGKLVKDHSICYLKLLLLKGDTATVEKLITEQPKRFYAAQLHWVRGVLALKQGQPETALTCFGKIKRPVTPGDLPIAWNVYTQQASGDWGAASNRLDLYAYRHSDNPEYVHHPILERLAALQQANIGVSPLEFQNPQLEDPAIQDALLALTIIQLINDDNHHDAAHVFLKMGNHGTCSKELENLRPSIFILAGQQALNQRQLECAEHFWLLALTDKPFNPQLAVNLLQVLNANDSYKQRQQVLNRFLRWLEVEGRQKPQEWSDTRLKSTLAHLHCWMADNYMGLNRQKDAFKSLQIAETICPTLPEVVGRKGLVATSQKNYPEAVTLLTQAIEGGCRYEEVYLALLRCSEQLGDKQALNETRRRFGQHFGDFSVNTETEVPPWIDALSTLSYPFFSRLIQAEDEEDPAVYACQIFVDAVESAPNSGGRVSLNQKAAIQEWDSLLEELSHKEQIPVLQAIALCVHLFSKREKGIAALITQYRQRLIDISIEHPEARVANLVILAVKEKSPQKLEYPVQFYLQNMPQPGNALANIQLQARRFGKITTLLPALESALQREPQNPLLLLAKATTYDTESRKYEQLKQQGFELARRLQDAKALQAFREEQAFLDARESQSMMPDPEEFEELDISKIDDFLSIMIEKLFGSKIPQSELEKMMPEIKQRMLNDMPNFLDDDEEDDDYELDLDFIFRDLESQRSKGKARRKRGFRELL